MADIVIRGMDMPKDGHIVVRIYANGDVCEPTPCPGVWRKVGELSPLPEKHGELIERKALKLFPDYKEVRNRIKRTIKATERDGRTTTGVTIDFLKQTLVALDSLRSVRRYFLNAKSIVPAEGGVKVENNICFACKYFSEYPECPAANDETVFASNGDTIVHCKAYEEAEGGGEDA